MCRGRIVVLELFSRRTQTGKDVASIIKCGTYTNIQNTALMVLEALQEL